ncbi:hypothetical protein [Streptomyces sp. H-KF8]|uniref:hypothetical protein n=1 Tax=Streptomyces sp. H-KF8 TaxID=1727216 RepID=UPI0013315E1B|nr:hypothetical protein [Streptomyces sp. H-KF8]
MKKSYSTLLAAMGIAACFTLGLQGTANAAPTAWPTGCSNGKFDNGWEARCSNSNGGSYKATVLCKPFDGGDLVVRDAGVWKTSGISYVSCPPLTGVNSGGIITRSTR